MWAIEWDTGRPGQDTQDGVWGSSENTAERPKQEALVINGGGRPLGPHSGPWGTGRCPSGGRVTRVTPGSGRTTCLRSASTPQP